MTRTSSTPGELKVVNRDDPGPDLGGWAAACHRTDLLPGNPVDTLKYYSDGLSSRGRPLRRHQVSGFAERRGVAINRATQASDDMVAVTGTDGGYYVWNFPNPQAQPIAIHDTLLGISTRYLTPPPTASGTTPVPDFQVLGTGYL